MTYTYEIRYKPEYVIPRYYAAIWQAHNFGNRELLSRNFLTRKGADRWTQRHVRRLRKNKGPLHV